MKKSRLPGSAAAAGSPAATRPSATEAGASARRIAPRLPAMVVVAESARPDAALTPRRSESSSSLGVSFERSRSPAGPVVDSAAAVAARAALHVPCNAPLASAAVVIAPVVKRVAPGVVPVVVINCVTVVPIKSPIAPAPSITSEEADSKTDSERKVGATKPDSGIWVPARPGDDGISVNQPGIVCGDINHIGAGRLNLDGRAFVLHCLLWRALEVSGSLRFLAHELYRIHHILLLVVVGVAERRCPGEVLVHIPKDRRKCSKRLDARVPRL